MRVRLAAISDGEGAQNGHEEAPAAWHVVKNWLRVLGVSRRLLVHSATKAVSERWRSKEDRLAGVIILGIDNTI